MRLYGKSRSLSNRTLLFVAGTVVLLGLFWWIFGKIGDSADAEQCRLTEEAIRRAAVDCYAIEGSYPRNLDYLVEHYGVQVDTGKFVVNYEAAGANLLPYIEVVPRGGRTVLDDASEETGDLP